MKHLLLAVFTPSAFGRPPARIMGQLAAVVLLVTGSMPLSATEFRAAESVYRSALPAATATQMVVANNAPQDPLTRIVRINLRDETLGSALGEISRQARIPILYSDDVVPAARRLSLQAQPITVGAALRRVLADTSIDFGLSSNGEIILYRRAEKPALKTQLEGTISGTVTDAATNRPLANVSVFIRELDISTRTDGGGRYRLPNVPPGTHVVTTRAVGYTRSTQQVAVASGGTIIANFALEVSTVVLNQVVVTGTVTPTAVREIPSPLTVITARNIEERGITSVEQLFMGVVPGVINLPNGVETDGSVRMLVRGSANIVPSGSPPLKTYVDGVYIQNSSLIGAIDPRDIERIEIIRGPQASMIYGAEAIVGVMQIFTKRGSLGLDRPQIDLRLGLGTIQSKYKDGVAARQDYRVTVQGGGGANFSYNIAGSYRYTGPALTGYFLDNKSLSLGMRRTEGPLSADFTLRLNHRANAGGGNNQYFAEKVRAGEFSYGPSYFIPSTTRSSSLGQTLGLNLSYAARSWWDHTLLVGQDSRESLSLKDEPSYMTVVDTFKAVTQSGGARRSAAYSSTIRAPLGRTFNLNLTAGGDYYRNITNRTSNTATTATDRTLDGAASVSRVDEHHYGYFGQARLGISDAFFVTGGLRTDASPSFGSDYGDAQAPRIGATYVRDVGSVLVKTRASWGRAIKLPPFAAKEGEVGGFVIILPNADIGPESQQGYDAGIDLFYGRHASLEATYYDQTVDDLLLLPTITETPFTRQYQNFGQVRNRGWELNGMLSAPQLPQVRLEMTYSRMSSLVQRVNPAVSNIAAQLGEELDLVPKHSGSLALSYSRPGTTLRLDGMRVGTAWGIDHFKWYENTFARYRSPGDAGLGQFVWRARLQGTSLVNLGLTQDLPWRLQLSARVDNVLNSRIATYQNYLNAFGRQTLVEMRWRR